MLLTSGGHHWRHVQSCSLEALPPASTSNGGHRNTYAWQEAGTHPTGISSCFNLLLSNVQFMILKTVKLHNFKIFSSLFLLRTKYVHLQPCHQMNIQSFDKLSQRIIALNEFSSRKTDTKTLFTFMVSSLTKDNS